MAERQRQRPRDEVRLDGFSSQVDELLETGTNVLGQLRNQGKTFKSIYERLDHLKSNLGMSNTVMRLIESRSNTDKLILFGGMALFTLFMCLVWYYLL